MEFVARLFATMLFCVSIGVLCKGPQALCTKGNIQAVNEGASDPHSHISK
jgi:hypothetical protein